MKSMTGFGKAQWQDKSLNLNVNVKTVNGRFLDVRFHGTKIYGEIEDKMVKRLRSHFSRGTVDVYIQRNVLETSMVMEPVIDLKVSQKWANKIAALQKKLSLGGELEVKDLLSLEGVVKTNQKSGLLPKEGQSLLSVLDSATKSCLKERVREGRYLKKVCLALLKSLQAEIKQLKKLKSDFNKEARAKLEDRLQRWIKPVDGVDESRVLQELAVLLDRTDITEELDRLVEHMANMNNLLKSAGPAGKKLDFYAQELLRETNTIGSKSQSAKITERIVAAKSFIEQVREQVQNIE